MVQCGVTWCSDMVQCGVTWCSVSGPHSNVFLHKDDVLPDPEVALSAAERGEELR